MQAELPKDESDSAQDAAGAKPRRAEAAQEESGHDRLLRLSQIAQGLAHEIRNPLSTMSINLALLQEEWERAATSRNPEHPEPTPREERSLRRITTLQREVNRLEHLLDEFQVYARGGEGNRQPHDISRLGRELLERVEPENERAGIRQHAVLPVGLPLVLADKTQLKQAVLNLLVNARQAMTASDGEAPGEDAAMELLVRAQRVGNEVELSITDTGVGMDAESLERCFDEWWSNKKGGSGLGLSTARRIVEEHGGALSAMSEPGRGTCFSITLPLAVELAGQQSKAECASDISYEDPAVAAAAEAEIVEDDEG